MLPETSGMFPKRQWRPPDAVHGSEVKGLIPVVVLLVDDMHKRQSHAIAASSVLTVACGAFSREGPRNHLFHNLHHTA